MGQSVNQQLGMDPDYIRSQIMQRREQGFQQIQNPFQQAGARLGSLLGGGIANVANDRGFFEVSDPLLTKVTQIQGIYNQVAQDIDPAANPEQFYTALSGAYKDAGLGQQALLAMQEGQKAKRETLATQAAEATLYEKNPEFIAKELQGLAPKIESGDEKALQRYNELSNLLVRATNKQNLADEATKTDINYKKALASSAGRDKYDAIPVYDEFGKRIGTDILNKNTGKVEKQTTGIIDAPAASGDKKGDKKERPPIEARDPNAIRRNDQGEVMQMPSSANGNTWYDTLFGSKNKPAAAPAPVRQAPAAAPAPMATQGQGDMNAPNTAAYDQRAGVYNLQADPIVNMLSNYASQNRQLLETDPNFAASISAAYQKRREELQAMLGRGVRIQ